MNITIQTISDKTELDNFILHSLENNKLTASLETYCGTVLLLSNNAASFNPGLMKLDQCLLLAKPEQISYSTRFIVTNTRRERRTILSLLIANHKKLIENNIAVNLILCPKNLQEYFEHIGYCQYAKAHYNSEGLSLVPMLLLVQDYEYLTAIGSPLSRNLKESKLDREVLREIFGRDYRDPRIYIQLKKLATRLNVNLDEKLIEPYLSVLKYNVFQPNTNIFVEGELGSGLHIITAGVVSINHREHKSGGFFGIDTLLSPGVRRYTLGAESKVESLEIESEDFYKIMKSKPNTVPMILNLLGERLKDAYQ